MINKNIMEIAKSPVCSILIATMHDNGWSLTDTLDALQHCHNNVDECAIAAFQLNENKPGLWRGLHFPLFVQKHISIPEVVAQAVRQDTKYLTIEPTAKTAKPSREGFIYLMANYRNGYTKIGWSLNPVVREATLQAEDPDMILFRQWRGTKEDERDLHGYFGDKHKRGEWFSLDFNDLQRLEAA